MAKNLNVLFGFSSDKIQASITKEMVLRGCQVKSVKMTTKDLIKDYVKSHPEVDVIILKEYLDGGGVYSAIELTDLVDEVRNVNVVIVLATNHRGKNEMRELYSAGILNAFFSDGKFGANPDKLAELACKGRTRKEARDYYRINEVIPDHINLTFEEFNDNYKYLVDEKRGMNIINRFVQISHMLYPGQMGAFIDKLPDNVKQILMRYSEFYDIAHKVYKLGYCKQDYKRPKGIKEGITKEAIEKELQRTSKNAKKSSEPTFVAARSTNKPVKEEIEYDEPLGLERVEETPSVEEPAAPAPKKKGLFGGKKKEKKARNKGREEESIFEQESDVDFALEGVEPIEDDDSWETTPMFDERVVEPPAPRKPQPAPKKAVQREIEPPDYTNQNFGYVEQSDEGQQSGADEPVNEQMVETPTQPAGGASLNDLSVEELKKLLGN